MSMTPRKRTQNDENATQTPTFVNYSGPPSKKPRRVLQPITPQIRNESRRLWLEKEKEAEKEKDLQEQQAAEEKQRLEISRLKEMERARIAAGTPPSMVIFLNLNVEQGDHGQLRVVCTVGQQHGEVLLSHWLQQYSTFFVFGFSMADKIIFIAEKLRPVLNWGAGMAKTRLDHIQKGYMLSLKFPCTTLRLSWTSLLGC
jgi:hypothetical protein